ncbi:MAG TPA: UDP-N-acetylmuramoyl-L-alanyl-D-glutamate--2,6-diaminopimelate ligase [Mycobacteriales bacterium]|nr:UDP-N-acetylmuramoyl-L-alanyl-D-glutamate--2,6-diaminopimelate ligase [Mycobacteriales bacterium]
MSPSPTQPPRALRPEHPTSRPLAELAARLGLPAPWDSLEGGTSAAWLTGVTHASAQVRTGDLYAALPGTRTHGARFAGQAAAAGARAVLTDPAGLPLAEPAGLPVLVVDSPRAVLGEVADWVYGEPTAALTVLGVTGTSGKTTTCYLLDAGLAAAGHRTGLIGTVETRVAGEAVKSPLTTPEATDLHAVFAAMRERGVSAVSMEVSSHALSLGRVGGVRFAAGAFTNLSQDHLDFHADMEQYFDTKALLFDGRCGHEVVNLDDRHGRRLVTPATVTVSAAGDPAAAWRADRVEAVPGGGSRFVVRGPGGLEVPVAIRLPGAYNVANALLSLAVLATVGVDPAVAAGALAEVQVPGRMERVDAGQPYLAVVDYAHKPDAVAAALAALRPLTTGRLILVLGCGGDRDRGKRPMMGEAAARGADLVVVTDDNPRSEPPGAIRAAMAEGVRRVPGSHWLDVGDRREAIDAAVRRAEPGDTVLVAGKGHEQGQEVAGVVHPFDDRVVLREAIEAGRGARGIEGGG